MWVKMEIGETRQSRDIREIMERQNGSCRYERDYRDYGGGGIVSLQRDDETNKIREGEDGVRELREETEDIKERGTID